MVKRVMARQRLRKKREREREDNERWISFGLFRWISPFSRFVSTICLQNSSIAAKGK